jgi:protein-S-isoprenylcysteine O-methyltransferase Ste14
MKQLLASYKKFVEGKTRVVGAWLALIFLYFSISQTVLWIGVLIMFLGGLLRFVASGYIDKEGRLSIAGPYAYSRNPLYVGSFLLTIGSSITVGSVWLSLFYVVLFLLIYHFIILSEEDRLLDKFGPIFKTYCQKVPRYFPLLPWPVDLKAELQHDRVNSPEFSFELIKENKGYEGFFTFLGLLIFILAVAHFKHGLNF